MASILLNVFAQARILILSQLTILLDICQPIIHFIQLRSPFHSIYLGLNNLVFFGLLIERFLPIIKLTRIEEINFCFLDVALNAGFL